MKRTLNLCNWQRALRKVACIAGSAFLTLMAGVLIWDVMSEKDMSLIIFRLVIIACILCILIAAGYKIIKIKAREAIFYELNFLMKRYLAATNHPAKVEKISVNEYDYEHIYKLWLTDNIDLYKCEDLVADMSFLKDNIAINLNKRIHIYCNGEWVC